MATVFARVVMISKDFETAKFKNREVDNSKTGKWKTQKQGSGQLKKVKILCKIPKNDKFDICFQKKNYLKIIIYEMQIENQII